MKSLVDDVIFNAHFCGTRYAEIEGIWSNVSRHVLKNHVDSSLLKGMPIDSAISPWYDFSPMRSFTLLKRELTAERLLSENG